MLEIQIGGNKLVNADSLQYIKTLPDSSIKLILTDPPYFNVKDFAWDKQWSSSEVYLSWLDDFLAEAWRVLAPNGSIYMFCGSKLASDTEILMRERFNILNHIVWAKSSGSWGRTRKENLRSYYPAGERILFAEHYNSEGFAKGAVGYGAKCQELKGQVFKPLIEYFMNARSSLNISAKDIHAATGTQMCSHWFSFSQWQLPSADQYAALQALFERVAAEKHTKSGLSASHNELVDEYGELKRSYEVLSAEYDDLKQQYQHLRRPFLVTKDVPHTDVWTYKKVEYYPGKHPCEKPADMLEDIIRASSRPGDLVADFFMGSGSTLKAAHKLGRLGLGVEFEEERFNQTVSEIKKL